VHVDHPEELRSLSAFHGHLGPYVVVGYRMGQYARSSMNGKLRALVLTGTRPPVSCVVDGIQFSSGCTMGKGNIEVRDEGKVHATFSSGNERMEIELRDDVRRDINAQMTKETEEQLALSDSLFLVRRAPPVPPGQ
jgi:formylmethanofuran dehydrogenase subunit E